MRQVGDSAAIRARRPRDLGSAVGGVAASSCSRTPRGRFRCSTTIRRRPTMAVSTPVTGEIRLALARSSYATTCGSSTTRRRRVSKPMNGHGAAHKPRRRGCAIVSHLLSRARHGRWRRTHRPTPGSLPTSPTGGAAQDAPFCERRRLANRGWMPASRGRRTPSTLILRCHRTRVKSLRPGRALRPRDVGMRAAEERSQCHRHRGWAVSSDRSGWFSGWRRADPQSARRPVGLARKGSVARRRPRTFGVT